MNPLWLVLGSAILFSMKGIFAKFIYAEGVALATVLMLRAVLSIPVFWLWAARRGDLARIMRVPSRFIAAAMSGGILSYYIGTWCDFRGLQLVTASLERALLFAYPAFVVLLRAVWKRQWPSSRVLSAIAVTYIGIWLAVGGTEVTLLQVNAFGGALVLVSAILFAAYLLINERVAPLLGSLGFLVVAMTSSAFCLVVHFIWLHPWSELVMSPRAWGLIVAMTIFTNVLPLILMAEGVLKLGAQRAAILSSIGPPCTLGVGWWLLDEALHPLQLAGTAVIISGILILEAARAPRTAG